MKKSSRKPNCMRCEKSWRNPISVHKRTQHLGIPRLTHTSPIDVVGVFRLFPVLMMQKTPPRNGIYRIGGLAVGLSALFRQWPLPILPCKPGFCSRSPNLLDYSRPEPNLNYLMPR